MFSGEKWMVDKAKTYLLESTAYWTASVRALESACQDALFKDPWAAMLGGKKGQEWIEGRSIDSLAPIILRTRYFDDFLQRITRQEAIRQVVLIAAGLDTRAFRLDWPLGTRLFELDQSAVLAYKDQIMRSAEAQPTCERYVLGVDLTDPWDEKLISAGFDLNEPAVWLLEGFLFYLPGENINQLLDDVSRLAAPESWLGFDIINSVMLTSPFSRQWVEMQAKSGAPWIGILDDPQGYLDARGWNVTLTQAGQPDANYGRWPYPVLPLMAPDMPHNWFVTAQKRSSEAKG
jgi:methyltransferase (TIGR00027 family)